MRHSIIIPVHNCEKYLNKCLDSIIEQTDEDWECILIDDGSTDRSGKICDEYSKKDERFKVIHTPNKGVANARNLGIEKSSGEWLSFVDSDDYIESNKLQVCYDTAVEHDVKYLFHATNVYRDGVKTSVWHDNFPGLYDISDNKMLSSGEYHLGACWNKFYHASEIRSDKSLRFANCDIAEDLLFNIRVYYKFGKILSISDTLYNYNIMGGTLSHSLVTGERKLKYIHECESLFRDLGNNEIFKKNLDTTKTFLEGVYKKGNRDKNIIDYVFPYVDFNDREWRLEYNKHVSKDKQRDINGIERYRGYEDLLRYKFRSIAENLPWVGVIHLIVSSKSQVPKWIDQTKVHVVLHENIIPKQYLPTFNSSTIMLFTHNIFGLSEKYLVSNDDVFPNRRLQISDFFRGNKVLFKTYTTKASKIDPKAAMYKFAFYNAYKSALEKYKRTKLKTKTFYRTKHIDIPMLRSLTKEIFDENRKLLESSLTKFRDRKNINEYFYHWAVKYKNRASENDLTSYVNNITEKKLAKYKDIILHKTYQYLCINDSENTADSTYAKLVSLFQQRYPRKSKYEKTDIKHQQPKRNHPIKKYERVTSDKNMPDAVRHFYAI